MTIERIYKFRLTCDQCQQTIVVEGSEPFLEVDWIWQRYIQHNGYSFYSLTCSQECKEQWETLYVIALGLGLANIVPLQNMIRHA